MTFQVQLTVKNFCEASKIIGNDDFHFVISNQNIYCHKFAAAFLSNLVTRNFLSDPTFNSLYIQIPDQLFINEQNKKQCEQQIVTYLNKLLKGETIKINNDDTQKTNQQLNNPSNDQRYMNTEIISLLLLTETLDNDELRQQLYSHLFYSNELNNQQSNIVDEIELKLKKIFQIESVHNLFKKFTHKSQTSFDEDIAVYVKKYLNEDYEKLIKEIASNFYQIKEEILISIKPSMMEDILSANELKIKSEDSLLQFLLHRKQFNQLNIQRKYDKFFFEYVQYEFVSENVIKNFISELEIDQIDAYLWNSLKKRLCLPVKQDQMNQRANQSFESIGIFQYLTTVTNGNIIENSTIEVKNPYLCCGDVKTLFNFNDQKCWTHIDPDQSQKSWIQFDFKTRRIQINSYMIKSRHGGGGSCYLKSWHIEISEDGNNWSLIDSRNNVTELNGSNKSNVFNISTTKPFRFIKLISDENWFNIQNHSFSIANIEIYGRIIE